MDNNINEKSKRKETAYSRLSEEQRKKKIIQNTKRVKEKYTTCTANWRNEDFVKVNDYFNKCINKHGNITKGQFIKDAVKFAIDNDFKRVND